MRLINADELCFTSMLERIDQQFAEDAVNEAPTVEAIPVEWLEDFRDGLDTLSESQLMRAIDLIIDAYRVEKKREEHGSD